MSDIEKAYQATPAATLEQQIMDPNFPKNEREWWAADRIEQLEAENASLASWQCEFTDGKTGLVYGQGGTTFCIMAKRMQQLEAEVKVWQGHAKTAIWSDSEECKLLTRINAALIAAPTVDIDVVVPDRDYSAMTPKDCYEAGLLDGVYQAREAIKAATRAALEERT